MANMKNISPSKMADSTRGNGHKQHFKKTMELVETLGSQAVESWRFQKLRQTKQHQMCSAVRNSSDSSRRLVYIIASYDSDTPMQNYLLKPRQPPSVSGFSKTGKPVCGTSPSQFFRPLLDASFHCSPATNGTRSLYCTSNLVLLCE